VCVKRGGINEGGEEIWERERDLGGRKRVEKESRERELRKRVGKERKEKDRMIRSNIIHFSTEG